MDSGMIRRLKPAEELRRSLNVASDLFAQQLWGVELPLVAQAPKELQSGGRRFSGNRTVEDKCFDSLRAAAESRAGPDVGDGIDPGAAIHFRTRDIDALVRNQLIFRRQVERGNGH